MNRTLYVITLTVNAYAPTAHDVEEFLKERIETSRRKDRTLAVIECGTLLAQEATQATR